MSRNSVPMVLRHGGPTAVTAPLPAVSSPRRWARAALLATTLGALLSQSPAQASYIIFGGSASFTLLEGKANAISEFDAYFDASTTRAQCLSLPAPGNLGFTETLANVTLQDAIRPSGEVPLNDAGGTTPGAPGSSRTRQATTLQIENLGNVLGSWSTSADLGAFVGLGTPGEQIALTSMQRWTGPFAGSLLYGDFALRYTGSKLVLTSNIDFLGAAFADIGNTTISVLGNTLTISGDLLIGGGLNALDASAIPGTNFGNITITATLADTAVPEPTSIALMAIGFGGLGAVALRQRQRSR